MNCLKFRHLIASVVVNDLDLKRVAFRPYKADAVLLIDSDTVLTSSIAFEGFQPEANAAKIVQGSGLIQKEKSPKSDALERLETRHPFLTEEPFGVAVRKSAYQATRMILRCPYYVKRIILVIPSEVEGQLEQFARSSQAVDDRVGKGLHRAVQGCDRIKKARCRILGRDAE